MDCFYRCNFMYITLPDSLEIIGTRAFGSNNGLKKVNIPEGVGIINSKVFHCCAIEEIKFPTSLKVIDFKAFAQNKFTKVVFPPYLTNIENEAFFKCEQLKNIELPATIKKIGTDAFGYCNISVVNLPTDFSECFFDWAFNFRSNRVLGNYVIDRNGLTKEQEKECELLESQSKKKVVKKNDFEHEE